MLQVVGPRIALDGVHVAEQLGNRRMIRFRMLADDPLVLADKPRRAFDEVMELLFADRENLADHVETATLFAGFRRELAQFGDVAHAQHQAHDDVVFIGNRRPAQIENLHAAIGHALRNFADQQVLIEREVDAVFAEARMRGGIDLRQRVGAEIGVARTRDPSARGPQCLSFRRCLPDTPSTPSGSRRRRPPSECPAACSATSPECRRSSA